MDTMEEQLGVAVIGCGYWGINYVRVMTELSGSRVVVICDQRMERLREVGQRFPNAKLTTDISEALQTEGVAAAVVCTEAKSHHGVVRSCLEAGKHVLVEKPITTTASDARDLIDLADANGVTLMVGHTFLYNPGVTKIKEYIRRGDLGRLYYLYARRTNLGPIRRDVNALWDLAPHDISIFNYLLDSVPAWASAVGAKVLKNCREDVGFISLGYPDNIVAHIHVSWADPNKVREAVIVGSNKRIVFSDLNTLEQVRVFEKGIAPVAAESEISSYGEYQLQIRDGDIVSPRIEVSEPLKNQCIQFLECVAQGTRPLTDGWAGEAVVRVMEAIDRSIESNGVPIAVAENLRPQESQIGEGEAEDGKQVAA
ncbi:MAG: Gfo/Idh/MocA family protein [Chloroflexia bacterium]